MKISSSLGVPLPYSHNHHNHRPRHLFPAPPPGFPRNSHISSAYSLEGVTNNKWTPSWLVEADIKPKLPWIISFSPKSCPPATLLLQEKMLVEAHKAYPKDHWETIWPLPGYPGVLSFTRKVLRWVEPPEQREKYQEESEKEFVDWKPVPLVWSLPGWKVERIALPDVNTHEKSRIDQDVLVLRHRQRERRITKSTIVPFKKRKHPAKVDDDKQRKTVYNMLRNKIFKLDLKCKVSLFDNGQSNSFIILCEPEPKPETKTEEVEKEKEEEKEEEKEKEKKPLLVFLEGNFGEQSVDNSVESVPLLSWVVAATLGWEVEHVRVNNGAEMQEWLKPIVEKFNIPKMEKNQRT